MQRVKSGRILVERCIGRDGETLKGRRGRAVRSVTVNAVESPLGWLFARGFLTRRQFEAGEQLRSDWERASLAPGITMKWDASGTGSSQRWSGAAPDLTGAQIDARRRFDGAIAAAGAGLADISWRIVCAGEGMREAESALGWPARAGRLVLTLALDRIADFYRIR